MHTGSASSPLPSSFPAKRPAGSGFGSSPPTEQSGLAFASALQSRSYTRIGPTSHGSLHGGPRSISALQLTSTHWAGNSTPRGFFCLKCLGGLCKREEGGAISWGGEHRSGSRFAGSIWGPDESEAGSACRWRWRAPSWIDISSSEWRVVYISPRWGQGGFHRRAEVLSHRAHLKR